MKSIYYQRNLIVVVFILVSTLMSATTVKIGDLYYILSGTSATITYETQDETNYQTLESLYIPESVEYEGKSYKVTTIGTEAFYYNNSLTYVKIPATITRIEGTNFGNCTSIKKLDFEDGPDGLYLGGGISFYNSPLESIHIGRKFIYGNSYGELFFQDKKTLTSVTMGNSVTRLSDYFISGCTNIKNIKLSESLYAIGISAFEGCTGLTSIEIPNTVKYIDKKAFKDCIGLTSVKIPDLKYFYESAFEGCTGLTSVEFSDLLQSIPNKCFYNCSNLQSIIFPQSLGTIGEYAFSNCSKLTSINLPESINTIDTRAFYNCTGLTSLYLPKNLKTVKSWAFYNCKNITTLEIKGVETIEQYAFDYGHINTVILPPSLKYLGKSNFNNSNLIFLNGDFSGDESIGYNKFWYILDNKIPNLSSTSSHYGTFVVFDKDTFVNTTGVSPSIVSQINEGLNGVSFNYTGIPQGPNHNVMKWNVGEFLTSLGFSYTFEGTQNVECGHWQGTENVIFTYKDWFVSTNLGYDYYINPIPLTVRVNDSERTYGVENPTFTFDLYGLVERDLNSNNVLDNISFNTKAVVTSDVGLYPISLSATAKNYTLKCTNGTLTINKAPLTVTVLDAERVYGQSNPKFSFSYDGFRIDDTEETSFTKIPTASTDASEKSDVGVYPILGNGGIAKNYDIVEYKSGNLTITKAPLTLSANDVTRNYYSENPIFNYTLTGLVNNDDESCITTAPTFSCAATISSDCGQYTITPLNAFAKNYNITYKEGMLNILPILLTLIPTDASRYYGDVNPEFSIIAEGLKGDDTLDNALAKEPTITTLANESSDVGEYPILVSNGEAKNYTLGYRSGTLSVSKAPLTLKINDAARGYGQNNPDFEISYEGFKLHDTPSSAFTQYPTISTEANINSNVGVYPIIANGGASKNYEITEYTPGNLSITKAPLTLSANNAERFYYTENPEFDYTLTGLLNGDDESCLTKDPDYTCVATIKSDCGEYEIVPSNAQSTNYDINYKNGLLSVNKAPLSISVVDVTREYGDPNPQFQFIYSGIKEDDVATALSILPKATCSARPNSPVGYYDIEVSGAESDNYEITYTPGILTVKAAPLTIRPKDANKIFGSENPDFELSYLGFKNEDNESCLFRQPQISTIATKESPVGQYPIVASNAAAKNYSIEYEEGVLTIGKGILTAKVNDASRVYGDENPQFSITYSGFLNGEDESIITSKPQFYTEADRTSKTGVYTINASGGVSANYAIDYKSGELTITPRQISAAIGNYSRPYGESNPQFVVEYEGFVNGDDIASISNPPTISCNADLQSSVGSYPISLSGGRGENYEVTSYKNGVLTIVKANQTIEWTQDLGNVTQYETIELTATSSSGLPVSYEVAPNSIVDIYSVGTKTLMECYGTGTLNVRALQSGNENYNAAETIINKLTVVSEGTIIDPSYPEISINVTTPGSLSSKINASKKYQIKSLIVSGSLNGTDIRYIREMAGRDVNGTQTNGILEKLNLSRATIVSGGDYYYTSNAYTSGRRYTSNYQISDYMFYGCSTLTTLTLPTNSIRIGDYAFDGCSNLSTIIMPDDIQSIGMYAFNGDISLTRISIPNQTVSIGNYAFQNCKGLSTLLLGSSLKNIGVGMLNGCPNIQEISLNDNNTHYSTNGGVLYNKDRTSLIIYPAGKQLETFEIPSGVIEIKNSAFFGTSALKYIFLAESLTTIGADAFKGCSNLSKLYSRPNTPPECENECFEIVSKSNCTLYVPRGSYNSYWVAQVWGDFLNIRESNDLSVGGNITKPDYCFEFTETTLNKGKFTYIPVSMNNVDPVVAFNCDIVLPDGVAFYKDADDQIVFKPSERFPMSQNINSNLLPNGVLRVISTSSSNEAFHGTEGILFYLPLLLTDVDANEDSEYNLIVKDIEFTKKNQSGYSSVQSPDMTVTLTVGEYNMGDANGDGRITGADAVLAMSYFLGKNAPNLILKAADMNYDGKITSIDVVLITDELLAQNQSPKAFAKGLTKTNGNLIVSSTPSLSSDITLNISLPTAYKFTAIQMDVTIPDGYNIKEFKLGSDIQTSHNLKCYQHPNGMTRIFISSDNNVDFNSDNLLSIDLEELSTFHSLQEFRIEDVLAVEISNDEINEWDVCGYASNISDLSILSDIKINENILVWVENSTIYIKSSEDGIISLYDMSGRVRSVEINAGITSIPVLPGIYLINKNKIIVK